MKQPGDGVPPMKYRTPGKLFFNPLQSPNLNLTKIMLKTLCQMSAPNPIKHYLDTAQVNTLVTGCWLFWDVSFFLFMFCFLNHSVTNRKQMSKPLIFLHTSLFVCFFLDNSQRTTLNSSIDFFLL